MSECARGRADAHAPALDDVPRPPRPSRLTRRAGCLLARLRQRTRRPARGLRSLVADARPDVGRSRKSSAPSAAGSPGEEPGPRAERTMPSRAPAPRRTSCLEVPGPQRPLALQRRDRVHGAPRGGRDAALASDRPRKRTLPCSTSSAMAPTVSSIGHLRVDPVLVVRGRSRRRRAGAGSPRRRRARSPAGRRCASAALAAARSRTWWPAAPRRAGRRSPRRPAPRCARCRTRRGVEERDPRSRARWIVRDGLGAVGRRRSAWLMPMHRGRARRRSGRRADVRVPTEADADVASG